MGEYRNTKGEKRPATVRERRSLRNRILWYVLLGLLLVGTAGKLIKVKHRVPAAGYVTTAEYAEVRAPAAGRVQRIAASSGDSVHQGDLLVQLEDAAEQAQLAETKRQAERGQAELELREAELSQQKRERESRIAIAELALEHARQRLATTTQLSEKGLASGRDLMEDTFRVRMAETEYQTLKKYDITLAKRQVDVLRRQVDALREAVARARANLEMRAIRAPIDGRLLRHTFYIGEVVRPDMVLYEVFGGEDLILKLRVPEKYAARVATNQAVRAQLRTEKRLLIPYWFHGHVAAMRDAIQVDGPRTYRVVYCPFDPRGRHIPPGATADAQICVGRASLWRNLFDL